MNTEEYIERTLNHHIDVLKLLFLIFKNKDKLSFKINEFELLKRGFQHDVDKFTKQYAIDITNWFFHKDTLSKKEIERIGKKLEKHKINNRHHKEYFIKNNEKFNNEDICEMVCDWIGSIRKDDNSIKKSSKEWKKDFDKIPELQDYKDKFYELFDLFDNIKY